MDRHDANDLVIPTLGESRQCGGQRLNMICDKNHRVLAGRFGNKLIFSRLHFLY